MFYSVLLVAVIATALYLQKRGRRLSKDERRHLYKKVALWASVAIVLVLAATGRAHWLMGVIAGLIGIASRAVQLAAYFPILKKFLSDDDHARTQSSPTMNSNTMSRADAAQILGVSEDASEQETKEAHKKLMQKCHPDRGGTDALAAQINKAKELMLGNS